jgi:Fe-S-cluster containining protein
MANKDECRKCTEKTHCCIFKNNSGFTFVGIATAKTIRKKIKKEYSHFLDYSPLPKKIVANLKNDDPLLEGSLRYSQLDKKNRILRLKTKKDGRCIFLNDWGKCDIYSLRPNVCRIFPYWAILLIDGRLKVIEHDSNPKCRIIASILDKSEDVESVLSKKEIIEIRKIFIKIENEDRIYRKNIQKFTKSL